MECFWHYVTCILVYTFFQAFCKAGQQKLLMISLDGFRHDYLDRAKVRNVNISAFEKIWRSGLRVMKVHNEFITRTAPNHLSLVTGMHEESHGIVDNTFYDPELNDTFDLINSSESKWFDVGSEPIWVTNQRHGHKSAVSFWPGSNTQFKGQLPSFYYPHYSNDVPLVDLINQTIEWLSLDEVTLGLLYFHEPDSQGHLTGPDSPEIFNVIEKLNNDIGFLLSLIDTKPSLKSILNVILTSDHGMSSVDTKRTIVLNDYIDDNTYYSPGPEHRIVWLLWPKDGVSSVDLYEKLIRKHPKMNVFLKNNIPARLHYSENRRISPIVVYSEPGWMIVKSQESVASYTKHGDHGYDPDYDEMAPFFLAMGPGFRSTSGGRTINSIRLIDIYPLMCTLLDLTKPAPNNGSLSRVIHLLHGHNVYFSSFWICSLDYFFPYPPGVV
ncbi:Ectonucleotide pyrophosphatase/phosphodiesterase family member 5 [Schistosoma japonicum]|nr:Ectonucleotide pyrophosphatase/phosphodiesterase family member 5 [Schistosoma japonicum]